MRRLLSLLTSFALVLCLAPGAAYAADDAGATDVSGINQVVGTDYLAGINQIVEGDQAAVNADKGAWDETSGQDVEADAQDEASEPAVEDQQDAKDRQATAQIALEGGSSETSTETGERIVVSKYVEPTGIENYFDITLRADIEEAIQDSSTAVVLVMDISNTMNEIESSTDQEGETSGLSRLQSAQAAANAFIKEYCEGEGLSPDRQLGVITFNTDAQWASGLQMQTIAVDSVEALQGSIDAITAPSTPGSIRFTNMEAGLQLAYNTLSDLDVAHKYVIFLTDGFPTTYIDRSIAGNVDSDVSIKGYDPYEQGGYNESKVGEDGYFADAVLGLPCTYGTSYSDMAAQRAAEIAALMKQGNPSEGQMGINIFSVGIDIGGQIITEYVKRATGTYSVVDRTSTTYEIGSADNSDAYAEWLGSTIAGGPSVTEDSPTYADGDNARALNEAFDAILKDIRAATGLMLSKALTIDPMGENVDFQYFYDVDGRPASELSGEYGQSEPDAAIENTASFTEDDASILWDLLNSGYTVTIDNDDTRSFHFNLKYRIRLMNESEDFPYDTAVPANDGAVLEYQFDQQGDEDPQEGTLTYPDPEVIGFAGTIVIEKVDALFPDQPVEGAVFKLVHSDSCEQCAVARLMAGDQASEVSISDSYRASAVDGMVRFENIPSGHGYVLSEAEPAEGYLPSDLSYQVEVGFGDTVAFDAEGTQVYGGASGEEALVVENTPIETPVDPVDPDTPVYPVDPASGDIPVDEDVPTAPTAVSLEKPGAAMVLPKTGDPVSDAALALVAVAMMALVLSASFAFKRRRDN